MQLDLIIDSEMFNTLNTGFTVSIHRYYIYRYIDII